MIFDRDSDQVRKTTIPCPECGGPSELLLVQHHVESETRLMSHGGPSVTTGSTQSNVYRGKCTGSGCRADLELRTTVSRFLPDQASAWRPLGRPEKP